MKYFVLLVFLIFCASCIAGQIRTPSEKDPQLQDYLLHIRDNFNNVRYFSSNPNGSVVARRGDLAIWLDNGDFYIGACVIASSNTWSGMKIRER